MRGGGGAPGFGRGRIERLQRETGDQFRHGDKRAEKILEVEVREITRLRRRVPDHAREPPVEIHDRHDAVTMLVNEIERLAQRTIRRQRLRRPAGLADGRADVGADARKRDAGLGEKPGRLRVGHALHERHVVGPRMGEGQQPRPHDGGDDRVRIRTLVTDDMDEREGFHGRRD